MIAMRYGCVPIVRAAGGLNDTVKDGKTGFVFEKIHHMALMAAIKHAFKIFADKEAWRAIQREGMSLDFSWENSAKKYLELYQSLIKTS
jgi:starch synthase